MEKRMRLTQTWFAPDARAVDVGDADIVFGATHLLREFLELAAGMSIPRRIQLVAPFLDRELFEEVRLFGVDAARMTDLLLITTPAQARGPGVRFIIDLPWRSCEVRVLNGLHSKLYMALPERGAPVALLGSHNLTVVGSTSNHEIGVLVNGRSTDGRTVIAGLEEHVVVLRAHSRSVHDSLSPFSHAA
jgi:hypothetical protein